MQNSAALTLSSDLIKQACIRWPVLVPPWKKDTNKQTPPHLMEVLVYMNLMYTQIWNMFKISLIKPRFQVLYSFFSIRRRRQRGILHPVSFITFLPSQCPPPTYIHHHYISISVTTFTSSYITYSYITTFTSSYSSQTIKPWFRFVTQYWNI